MANEEQLAILKQGVEVWNKWREENPDVKIELNEAKLMGVDLHEANLCSANLYGADLREADFRKSNLSEAKLHGVDLSGADLRGVNLNEADLQGAKLSGANLKEANLSGGKLSKADLMETVFSGANLSKADLSGSDLVGADLNKVNLRGANLKEANLSKADLSGADLIRTNLNKANLTGVYFSGSYLNNANLIGADLSGADLNKANLREANLSGANLSGADLSEADLSGADFSETNLRKADLSKAVLYNANLREADLRKARLSETNLHNTRIGYTIFANIDLSQTYGLEDVHHASPSTIGTDTIRLSKGEIPEVFLRGCGLSDWEIESAKLYKPGLSNQEINNIIYKIFDLRASQAIQISPLFISYSHADTSFVEKLEPYLIKKGIRFWRDVHNMTSGRMEKQVDHAMRQNPTVILILSENSTRSDWVEHEARLARDLEKEIGRDVLCPIALDDSWKTAKWPARLMEQIMEYNILDYSKWNDDKAFGQVFNKMLSGLDMFYKPDAISKK